MAKILVCIRKLFHINIIIVDVLIGVCCPDLTCSGSQK